MGVEVPISNHDHKTGSWYLLHVCPEMQANEIQCSLWISITKCHFHITSYLTELGVFWWLQERGHSVMLVIKSINLINMHFWTYLTCKGFFPKFPRSPLSFLYRSPPLPTFLSPIPVPPPIFNLSPSVHCLDEFPTLSLEIHTKEKSRPVTGIMFTNKYPSRCSNGIWKPLILLWLW